jgi:hydroxyacylglutathione hydrolase
VIDLRDRIAFAGAHIPGALAIGTAGSLATWASWLVPYDRPILLVANDESQVAEARKCLYRVGLDQVNGYLEGGFAKWSLSGMPVAELRQISAQQLYDAISKGEPFRVVDIREKSEGLGGRIPGATMLQGGGLAESLEGIPAGEGPLVMVCNGGYRSMAVSSLLQRKGVDNLLNLTGGMVSWRAAGLPLE